MGIEKTQWQNDALCATPAMEPYKDIFFSEEEEQVKNAKRVCGACPVRKECLQWALDNKEIWGVWGGSDEYELRVVLSVDETGQEVRRIRKGEAPFCPNCRAPTDKLFSVRKKLLGVDDGRQRKLFPALSANSRGQAEQALTLWKPMRILKAKLHHRNNANKLSWVVVPTEYHRQNARLRGLPRAVPEPIRAWVCCWALHPQPITDVLRLEVVVVT